MEPTSCTPTGDACCTNPSGPSCNSGIGTEWGLCASFGQTGELCCRTQPACNEPRAVCGYYASSSLGTCVRDCGGYLETCCASRTCSANLMCIDNNLISSWPVWRQFCN